jgi:hypothetical protein
MVPEPPARDIVLRYTRLRAGGRSARETARVLREEFGETKYSGYLVKLVNKNYGAFVQRRNSREKFEGLPIPRCRSRDSCRSCLCRQDCFRERWRQLRAAFRKNARQVDQRAVLEKSADLF